LHDLAEITGLPPKTVSLIGETTLAHLKTRPDYAVTVSNALIGAVRDVVGIRCGAISGSMKVSFQAARSIG
jgi:hypothetical protein